MPVEVPDNISNIRWQEKEIAVLKESTDKTCLEIQKLLPNRSRQSIALKCQRLGLLRSEEAKSRAKTCGLSGLTIEKIKQISKSRLFKDLITGSLLGDGCVSKWRFSYGSSCEAHVNFISQKMTEVGLVSKRRFFITSGSQIQGRKMPNVRCFTYDISNRILFEPIRTTWYENKAKIVPEDIDLTPLACLIWYLGDGSLHKGKAEITLCTNGFTLADNEILAKKLSDVGLKVKIRDVNRLKRNGDRQFQLFLYGPDALHFLEYIGPCPFVEYSHKWAIGDLKIIKTKCYTCGKEIEYTTSSLLQRGINCTNCKTSWSKKKIKDKILTRKKLNLPLNYNAVRKTDLSLCRACHNIFGGWNNALEFAGIEASKVMLIKRWSKESVLREICKSITNKEKRTKDFRLYNAVRYYFGSWKNAMESDARFI